MPLPCPKTPFILYDSERISLRSPVVTLLHLAKRQIHILTFSFDDPFLLKLLDVKHQEGLDVQLCYDKRYEKSIRRTHPKASFLKSIKGGGLVHEKIVCIDTHTLFFSTCNWSLNSEILHRNMMLGLYSPELASAVESEEPCAAVDVGGYHLQLFRLEKAAKTAFKQLTTCLNQATSHIQLVMFTLTHQGLIDCLIDAHIRGVRVDVIVDKTCAKGASAKALKKLRQAGIEIFTPDGELVHHKWALIDGSRLIFGSANWTKAAFNKNRDFLLFVDGIKSADQRRLSALIERLKSSCQNNSAYTKL